MPIEGQVNNIADLNPAYPQADDPVSQGDNHVRLIKKAIKDTFPNIDGTVLPSEDELNQLVGKDLPGDVTNLEGRVTKNEADIAQNKADIATNASNIATNTSNISTNANNIASNDSDIASLNSRVNALENAPEPGLIPHGINDHTDVNTAGVKNGQALIYKDGVWVPVDILGGGTVNFMTQPTTAGDATLNGFQQTYELKSWNNMGYATQTMTVPAGAVFIMEYFFGQASDQISVKLNEIKIDGKPLMSQSVTMSWSGSGGSVWPGSEGFTPIIVRESIEVRAYVGQNGATFSIAGMFSEKP